MEAGILTWAPLCWERAPLPHGVRHHRLHVLRGWEGPDPAVAPCTQGGGTEAATPDSHLTH